MTFSTLILGEGALLIPCAEILLRHKHKIQTSVSANDVIQEWAQEGVPRIDVHDDFFDLGGHSLLTIQVHRRISPLVDRPVAIADLFHYSTVHKLAAFLTGG
jgi:hypothetical protein